MSPTFASYKHFTLPASTTAIISPSVFAAGRRPLLSRFPYHRVTGLIHLLLPSLGTDSVTLAGSPQVVSSPHYVTKLLVFVTRMFPDPRCLFPIPNYPSHHCSLLKCSQTLGDPPPAQEGRRSPPTGKREGSLTEQGGEACGNGASVEGIRGHQGLQGAHAVLVRHLLQPIPQATHPPGLVQLGGGSGCHCP